MKTPKMTNPAEWEVEALILAIGALDDEARTGALSVLAHYLTVEIEFSCPIRPSTSRCLSGFEPSTSSNTTSRAACIRLDCARRREIGRSWRISSRTRLDVV